MRSSPHSPDMTDQTASSDATSPQITPAMSRAHVANEAGTPVLSVNALVARLRASTTRTDLEHVCDVLVSMSTTRTITAGASAASTMLMDPVAGLGEWEQAVARQALGGTGERLATDDPPTVTELARLDAVTDSQTPASPAGPRRFLAAFADAAHTRAVPSTAKLGPHRAQRRTDAGSGISR